MDDEKNKRDTGEGEARRYKTEWSFSFEKIGDSINNLLDSIAGDDELKMASFSEPVGEAQRASIEIGGSVGETTISTLTASQNLIEADLTYYGEVEFSSSGGTNPNISLMQKTSKVMDSVKHAVGAARRQNARWDIRISPDVLVDLHVKGGVGRSQMNLNGLRLANLRVEGGVGEPHLELPEAEKGYRVIIKGGVGTTTVRLPDNTDIDLSIQGGVGVVRVVMPPTAAVRVEAESGLGDIRVPAEMQRLREGEEFMVKSGEWVTPNFVESEHRVNISFEGGVGMFQLQHA